MSNASVLYDLPGPRAALRNRVLGVLTVLAVLALAAYVIWRLATTGQLSPAKWGLFAYTTIWEQILQAMLRTLSAFAVAAIGALVVGFALGVARLSDHAWVRVPARWIVEILRAIPVLVFMMLLYYGLPVIGIAMTPYAAVVIALIAYNGSVLAEVVRSGVEALPRGQSEAGYAIGLRKSGVMTQILLPQAVRAMLPVIIAQLVVTLKDTALGWIITYNELLYLARLLGGNAQFERPIVPSTIVVGAIYIVLCVLLSWLATVVQRRLSRSRTGIETVTAATVNASEITDTELIAVQQADVPGVQQRGT